MAEKELACLVVGIRLDWPGGTSQNSDDPGPEFVARPYFLLGEDVRINPVKVNS